MKSSLNSTTSTSTAQTAQRPQPSSGTTSAPSSKPCARFRHGLASALSSEALNSLTSATAERPQLPQCSCCSNAHKTPSSVNLLLSLPLPRSTQCFRSSLLYQLPSLTTTCHPSVQQVRSAARRSSVSSWRSSSDQSRHS